MMTSTSIEQHINEHHDSRRNVSRLFELKLQIWLQSIISHFACMHETGNVKSLRNPSNREQQLPLCLIRLALCLI